MVCGCNQNLHRYVYMPIGGGGVLIFGVDLGLLLIDVAFCTSDEG